jgi:Zn-finger nucleic acid-binding protein
MNCPICNIPLTMSERQGIEIDYCPQCRGVWLDRGELDKIIERSTIVSSPVVSPQREEYSPQSTQPPREQTNQKPYEDDHHYDHHGKKKRKSWLSEILD